MARSFRSAPIEADDSAFVMFCFVLVLFVVVPWTLILLKRGIWSMCGWNKLPMIMPCTCPNCDSIKKSWKKKLSTAWLTKSYLIQFFIVAALVYLSICMNNYLKEVKKNKEFDPYEILGVEVDADEKDIKQAYRKLALVMHPDKNPEDPEARNKFMRLTNAYLSLTDPKAKENFLKYGNPDGPPPFSIGIPLPSFMSKEENDVMTLIILFMIILVIVPGFGYCLYAVLYSSNKYEILTSNEDKLKGLLHPKLKETDIPEIISRADEYGIYFNTELNPECDNIGKELGLKTKDPLAYKPLVLLQAFIHKISINDLKNIEDQKYVLRTSMKALSYLADLAVNSPIIMEILKFSQRLYQQLKPNETALMQLPYMTKEVIDKLGSAKYSFKDFIERSPEERKLNAIFDEQQAKTIEATIARLPKLSLEITCGVEGSEGIYKGDILTLKIKGKISRNHDNTENLPYAAHSNQYPQSKQEILWLIIFCDKGPGKCSSFRINRRVKTFSKSLNSFAIEVVYM